MPNITVDELLDKWNDALNVFRDESDHEGVNLVAEFIEDLGDLA